MKRSKVFNLRKLFFLKNIIHHKNTLFLMFILILGVFLQTLSITKIAYKLTKNKYGYEVYGMQTQN